MQLGETIATYDVDLALRGETGKFEIKGPNGDIQYVTCRANRVSEKAAKPTSEIYPGAFFIRKIAELVAAEKNDADSEARQGGTPMSGNGPFLLEGRHDIETPSANSNSGAVMPGCAKTDGLCSLELSYSARDAKSEEPCAFVYVNTGHKELSDAGPRFPLTAACTSYTELDAEIRKLHAQLDEICLRAKKNFYKSYAAAASA